MLVIAFRPRGGSWASTPLARRSHIKCCVVSSSTAQPVDSAGNQVRGDGRGTTCVTTLIRQCESHDCYMSSRSGRDSGFGAGGVGAGTAAQPFTAWPADTPSATLPLKSPRGDTLKTPSVVHKHGQLFPLCLGVSVRSRRAMHGHNWLQNRYPCPGFV